MCDLGFFGLLTVLLYVLISRTLHNTQLLIAISPITIEGSKIAPQCLAGSVARESENKVSTAELDAAAASSIERKMVKEAPQGEGVGQTLRDLNL
jgi:hypothetical protein